MTLPLQIDKSTGVPIYVQLAEGIRLLIHRGTLIPGDPLPTVRTLAVQLGVNANTVSRVYRELQADGLLRLERGVGTFVADAGKARAPRADFRQLDRKVADLIQLARRAGISAAELAQCIQTRWQEIDDVSR